MVKIGLENITPSTTVGGIDGVPKWFSNIENIAKEINKMFENYYAISGKKPPGGKKPLELSRGDAASFSDARATKLAEMAAVKNNQEGVIVMEDKFKELLAGFIKSVNTLKSMGYGENKIGDVILQAPFTVNQIDGFLKGLYNKHYGGLK